MVAETTFLLTSTEWILIKPVGSQTIVGDTLYIQEKTDLDSLVVSWGDGIKHHSKIQEINRTKKILSQFQAWKVVETENFKELA